MENIIITDLLTNWKYAEKINKCTFSDSFCGLGELMDIELQKRLNGKDLERINNDVALVLSSGYLSIVDLETVNIRKFFLETKIDTKHFVTNLEYLNNLEWFTEMEEELNTPREYFRFLGFINNYKIPH